MWDRLTGCEPLVLWTITGLVKPVDGNLESCVPYKFYCWRISCMFESSFYISTIQLMIYIYNLFNLFCFIHYHWSNSNLYYLWISFFWTFLFFKLDFINLCAFLICLKLQVGRWELYLYFCWSYFNWYIFNIVDI